MAFTLPEHMNRWSIPTENVQIGRSIGKGVFNVAPHEPETMHCFLLDFYYNFWNYNIDIFIVGHFGQVYLGTLLSDDSPQGIPVAIKTVKARENN